MIDRPRWFTLDVVVALFLVVLIAILVAGCRPAETLDLSDSPEITAAVAVDGAAAIVRARRDFRPAPPAVPKPGDPCPNCGGTGQLGDTKVMHPCPPCKGTGKVQPQPKGA